jgi:hypothetical protein
MEALGISRWLLEALLDRVKTAISEEAAQWQALEREIVFIKDEFEMMKSFLNSADGDHMKNQVARTWVGTSATSPMTLKTALSSSFTWTQCSLLLFGRACCLFFCGRTWQQA